MGRILYFHAMAERRCLECKATFQGRSDKKFCTDQCRSTHYNRRHQDSIRFAQEINRILRNNRRILYELNPGGAFHVTLRLLRERGFNFHYHTHTGKKSGKKVIFCYDQGYRMDGKNVVLFTGDEPSIHEW